MDSKITIGEWLDQYLIDSQQRHVKATFYEKKRILNIFKSMNGISEFNSVDTITEELAEEYLATQYKKRGGNAANKDQKFLTVAWKWGFDEYGEKWSKKRNPFKYVRTYKEKRTPRPVPKLEDFFKVLRAADHEQDRVILLAFLHTGVRKKEMFNLKRTDIEFRNERIQFWSRSARKGVPLPYWVPMSKELANELRSWWDKRKQMVETDSEHVFVNLDRSNVTKRFYGKPFRLRQHYMKKICTTAGVEYFGFDGIRQLSKSLPYGKGVEQQVTSSINHAPNLHIPKEDRKQDFHKGIAPSPVRDTTPIKSTKALRQLRAILSADVKGYSRLMEDDEEMTIAVLKSFRDIMRKLIEQYSGRVVDTPGDNLMAEFSSAVAAVDCAVAIQTRLRRANTRFHKDQRLEFRIGINIGDVVQDDESVYGNIVNIAARIEGLAEAGGICISYSTYDQVKDSAMLEFEDLGEQTVKNISYPVRVYKVNFPY